ncbi:BTAD domain-containing putative transcriptional regulator [Asanoa sp. WMMD1127]|uniref:BTAD domain-containing putative transcriptional regulator n=1 Tax=Asanoa sp. WMMD1127 TaxID=3016107 RepID=UPI00241694F0|nr:BTAD domain-containing putative transcriptional regulator [Asanoa sp. WMMD1127]MDG4820601.1 BTAD domain-containing putative transcriptional regulator [Asanoa sp. WMMD1127]
MPQRFEILGPIRVVDGDREIDLGPGKQRAVLAVLLLNANRPVPTTQIVDAVWQDEPPENGANVVQKYVAGLRRALEPDRSPRTPGQLLTLTEAGYLLRVPPGGLDADDFDQRVRAARSHQAAGALEPAVADLRAGLALWRAEAVAGLAGGYFAAARDRLGDARCAAYEALAEIEIARGRHAELVPELTGLVAEFPLREQLRYQLMLALYRGGRQAEALAAYRAAREFLAEEFGVEPGERLQELHRRMLRADPALLGPRPAAPVSAPPPVPVFAPPPPPPAPVRRSWRWGDEPPGWARVGAVLVTLAGAGMLTWLVIGAYAVHRRSRILGAIAVAYLALAVVSCALVDSEASKPAEEMAGLPIGGWFLVWFGGALHVLVLNFLPKRAPRHPDEIAEIERRVRRAQALELVRHHPAMARELGIGRPDVPGHFDDGGLVDVNSAPEPVLASLPGVGALRARAIAADRYRRGPFATVDDLAARGLVPPHDLGPLREILICV